LTSTFKDDHNHFIILKAQPKTRETGRKIAQTLHPKKKPIGFILKSKKKSKEPGRFD
jgi:hypothetical protein